MTKKPHFFKGYCRIGLTSKPIRQDEWDYGVEEAPDFVLSTNFLNEFPSPTVDEYYFTNPEDIRMSEYWITLKTQLAQFKDLINQNLKKGERQVTIGGDNCITFSSLLALLERVKDPSKVGFIQFDSHGEMCSFKGSDSKNFHGMYMRPFFEKFDVPEIAKLVPFKFAPEQALFFGDMILDGDEPEFFKKQKFVNITFNHHQQNIVKNEKLLKEFVSIYEYIHINFDVDIFHHSVSQATGIPFDGKWYLKEVLKLLEIISHKSNVSIDLSEVNPKKVGIGQTVKVAQTVLKTILQN